MTKRPRDIANDIIDCVETTTAKWTRQKKSEERHPGNVRYRVCAVKGGAFQWVQGPPGNRSSRKQPEQSWR
jgi:hypothetical protein